MKQVKVLLLEDDLETVAKLLDRLHLLNEKLLASEDKKDIGVTVLSEYTQTKYLNEDPNAKFDIILLDRDCYAGGSFHTLDLTKFGVEKVISISSTPAWNEAAQKLGVNQIVHKDYQDLDRFADKVIQLIEHMI